MSIRAYLSAGSNLGNRWANIEYAVECLKQGSVVVQVSSFFETEPVGFLDQPWFLNIAIELDTPLLPFELLRLCQSIEVACGRVRTFANAPRILDLDILLYADTVMNEADLIIPHPRLPDRKFVLAPLAQIAPDVLHPILKKSVRSLLADCPDTAAAILSPIRPGRT
jgi:2-amino-4-hydroxy-6-hydroxymethyldihydropteridine diphosphokinase